MAHRTKESSKPIRTQTLTARIDEDTKSKLSMLQQKYQAINNKVISVADVLEVIVYEAYEKEFETVA